MPWFYLLGWDMFVHPSGEVFCENVPHFLRVTHLYKFFICVLHILLERCVVCLFVELDGACLSESRVSLLVEANSDQRVITEAWGDNLLTIN